MIYRLFSLSLSFLILFSPLFSSEIEASAPRSEDLRARRFLQDSLLKFQRSSSQREWEQGFSQHLLDEFRHLSGSGAGRQALCQGFENMDPERLAVFRLLLEEEPEAQLLGCNQFLLDSLDQFIQERVELLQQRRLRIPGWPKTKARFGPSQEEWVSTQGGPVYFNGGLPHGHFALTFDDGPHPQRTPQILEALKEHQTLATFFVLGQNAQAHPRVLREILHHQHGLGGHTQSHPDLKRLSFASAVAEIQDGFASISGIVGFSDPFFRFPYGSRTSRLQDYLREQNIATFFWNVDTLDWKIKDPLALFDYALEQVGKVDRGIILFHDIHPQTAAIMPDFLEALAERQLQSVVFRAAD